jgi:hypothetical protein
MQGATQLRAFAANLFDKLECSCAQSSAHQKLYVCKKKSSKVLVPLATNATLKVEFLSSFP